MKKWLAFAVMLFLLCSGCAEQKGNEAEGAFQPVQNEETYAKILASYEESMEITMAREEVKTMDNFASDGAEAAGMGGDDSGALDYSGTNLQVEAVDEGDIVKTDGAYIYRADGNRVHVAEAKDGTLKKIDTLALKENAYISELYVDQERLVVVSTTYFAIPYAAESADAEAVIDHSGTSLFVYDIKDKENIELVREITQEGNFLTARKVGHFFYLITSQYPYVYRQETVMPPVYRDSAAGEETLSVSYDRIYYPVGVENLTPSQMMVGAVDLAGDEPIAVASYIGAGENVYMNETSLYIVANEGYDFWLVRDMAAGDGEDSAPKEVTENESLLYAFSIDGTSVAARANSKVPGRILNQFSMDEYKGHFRIATTVTDSNGATDNRVYILSQDLKPVGALTGLAAGETIYSARFMGDMAYLVTFEQVDPLFALDLSNPSSPVVLGELKIPGYSGYLHPYDENHLIGIGKEVTLAKTDWSTEPVPLNQGVKISLFDTSDKKNPLEVYHTVIGDRGSECDVTWNHKAFLFDRERNLLVLPMSVYTHKSAPKSAEDYGVFTTQGSYIFSIDTEKIELKYVLRSQTGGEYPEWSTSIDRNLYIGNVLYASSPQKITSLDLDSMKEIDALPLN